MKKSIIGLLVATFVMLGASTGLGVTITTGGSGNWSSTTPNAPWQGGTVPAANDDVIIDPTHSVTVNVALTIFPSNLTIRAGGLLDVKTTLTVNGATTVSGTLLHSSTAGSKSHIGDVIITSGGVWNETANEAIGFGGSLQNDGTFTANTGVHTFSGASKTLGGVNAIVIPSFSVGGTYQNNGTLTVSTTMAGAGTLTQGANSILNIGGTSATFTLAANANVNTVNYYGAVQTVKPTTYQNLTLLGSGKKTTTSVIVNGVFSMEGTATVSAAPTYGSSATLQYNMTTATTNGLEWTSPFVASGGIVITNTGAITLTGAKTNNATAPLAIRSGATLASGNYRLTVGGIFTNSGTFTAGTGTVEWNGAGAQTIATGAYYNVIFSGSGSKSIGANTTVAGNMSIAPTGSATADLAPGLNLGVGSLTLAGLGRVNGTWGSTSSAATFTNNTFFSASTGYLTVSTESRQAPLITAWPTATSIVTGQMLSASSLIGGSATNAAGASVPGLFAFDAPATMPPAGTRSFSVTFTPTDPTSYSNVVGNVSVAVANLNAYYVVSGNPSPLSPFDTWGNAAADIQTAVSKAAADLVPGTTECLVLVSNGTYNLTSSILITNGITLRGFGGRDGTFINGNYPAYSNRCITISNSATRATVDGFTITNGYNRLQAGGGIFATNGQVSILNCTIARNVSEYSGGGVGLISVTNVVITNCVISLNTNSLTGTGGHGAGIYLLGATGRITDCTISSNAMANTGAWIYGGGIYAEGAGTVDSLLISNCVASYNGFYSSPADGGAGIYLKAGGTITRCVINNNRSTSSGGGVLLYHANAFLTQSTIASNQSISGGGVNMIGSSRMSNCRVVGNYSTGSGAGVYNTDGGVRNCLIAGNEAAASGGGVFTDQELLNCTIVRNKSSVQGGGLYVLAGNAPMTNLIVFANQVAGVVNNIGGFVSSIDYSCSPDLSSGSNGNVTGDPLFVNPGSGVGTNAVLGDYHLQVGSPAIDSGYAVTAVSGDLEGNSRPVDGDGNGLAAYDMGAYEAGNATDSVFRCGFSTPTNIGMDSLTAVFTAYAAGPNTNNLYYFWTFGDGATSNWSSATRVISHTYGYGSFTVTLNVSNELGQVSAFSAPAYISVYPTYVYVTTNGPAVAPFGSWATATTNIQDAIYAADVGRGYTIAVLVSNGTYTVTNEISLALPVTLRGFSGNWNDTVLKGGYPATTNRILNISDAAAVVDGFTITNGNLGVLRMSGGGVNMSAGTVRNCLVIGNVAYGVDANAGAGGGIYCTAGSVLDCAIINNASTYSDGGGIYSVGVISNCLIQGNVSAAKGGGVRILGGALIDRCVISGNIANGVTMGGGGIYKGNSAVAIVRNTLVVGNQAKFAGGGVYIVSTAAAVMFENCTIAGNVATNGGGLFAGIAGSSLTNCIIANNLATLPGATNNIGGLTLAIGYSCSPELVAGVSSNITADPQFVNPGSGYGTNLTGGNFHLKAGSPCIGTGTNLSWMATGVDLDGEVVSGSISMGAYQKAAAAAARGAVILIR